MRQAVLRAVDSGHQPYSFLSAVLASVSVMAACDGPTNGIDLLVDTAITSSPDNFISLFSSTNNSNENVQRHLLLGFILMQAEEYLDHPLLQPPRSLELLTQRALEMPSCADPTVNQLVITHAKALQHRWAAVVEDREWHADTVASAKHQKRKSEASSLAEVRRRIVKARHAQQAASDPVDPINSTVLPRYMHSVVDAWMALACTTPRLVRSSCRF